MTKLWRRTRVSILVSLGAAHSYRQAMCRRHIPTRFGNSRRPFAPAPDWRATGITIAADLRHLSPKTHRLRSRVNGVFAGESFSSVSFLGSRGRFSARPGKSACPCVCQAGDLRSHLAPKLGRARRAGHNDRERGWMGRRAAESAGMAAALPESAAQSGAAVGPSRPAVRTATAPRRHGDAVRRSGTRAERRHRGPRPRLRVAPGAAGARRHAAPRLAPQRRSLRGGCRGLRAGRRRRGAACSDAAAARGSRSCGCSLGVRAWGGGVRLSGSPHRNGRHATACAEALHLSARTLAA